MALPEQMTNRWARRRDPAPGEGTLYWHVLMSDYPEVGELARQARGRVAEFDGLHLTPDPCLHLTTLVAGPAERFSEPQLHQMVRHAAEQLAHVPPITVSLGKIIYHPEAIICAITPGDALTPLRTAAVAATRATGHDLADDDKWRPHVTLCYSTSDQPAAPIIQALGMSLPERTVAVRRLSLVIQNGSELLWDWTIVGSADLGAPADTRAAGSSR
jgi:2'-5' RNA ligase